MGFKKLQKQVRDFDRNFGWTSDRPEQTVLHMQEELGEISRNMLKLQKYKKESFSKDEMNDEISDLLYLTLKLGNLLGIDLDEGWGRIEKRYQGK